MKSQFKPKRFQLGQGMTEYIIITALIAIAAIGAYTLFGKTIRNQVAGMANEMGGESSSASLQTATDAGNAAVDMAEADVTLGTYSETAVDGSTP